MNFVLTLCFTLLPYVLSKNFMDHLTNAYLIPTTGKWIYPRNDDGSEEPAQTPGTSTAVNPSNLEILEDLLSGFAQQVDTDMPKDIDKCFTEDAAMVVNQYYYSIINKLANSDFITIPAKVREFEASIDPAVSECCNNNQDLQNLLDKYHVKGIDLNTLYSKLANYTFTGSYQTLVDMASQVRTSYEGTQYNDAGLETGQLLQTVMEYEPEPLSALKIAMLYYSPFAYLAQAFNARRGVPSTLAAIKNVASDPQSSTESGTTGLLHIAEDKSEQEQMDDLKRLLEGFIENAQISDQISHNNISRCFDAVTTKRTLDFLDQSMVQILKGDLLNAADTASKFRHSLTLKTSHCLAKSVDAKSLMKAYGLEGKGLVYLFNKVNSFALNGGYTMLIKSIADVKHDITYDNMEEAGGKLGKLLNQILE